MWRLYASARTDSALPQMMISAWLSQKKRAKASPAPATPALRPDWYVSSAAFSGCLFDPSAAPGLGSHMFARKQRAGSLVCSCTLVEGTVTAQLPSFVFGEPGFIDLRGVVDVRQSHRLRLFLVHQRQQTASSGCRSGCNSRCGRRSGSRPRWRRRRGSNWGRGLFAASAQQTEGAYRRQELYKLTTGFH